MKRFLILLLSCALLSAFAANAIAAEIDVSGGAGVTPVSLTTTNGGLDGNEVDVTPTKLSVVVPTSLPLAMSDDGEVVTATGCQIVNHSYGAVRVKSVTIKSACGWHLTSFGPKETLAGEKVDSNRLGFSLRIGSGAELRTAGEKDTQVLLAAPASGCYMTGAGDPTGNSAKIDYAAIVTPLSGALRDATVATVVFVIEWDTEN